MTGIRLASARLVARLARRLERRSIGRGLSLPLVAPAPAVAQHLVHRHTRFGDVLQSRLTRVTQRHVTFVVGAVTRSLSQATRVAPLLRAATPVVSGPLRLPLAQRLALREARVEATPPVSAAADTVVARKPPATAPRIEAGPRAMTAMPVLQRDRRAGRHEGDVTVARAGDRLMSPEPRRAQATPPGHTAPDAARIALPDGEIERLAGRVIDSIDRRIAAQRERVGRF